MRRDRFKWAVHNLIGHPVMEILGWFGMYELGGWIHDATVPTFHRNDFLDPMEEVNRA